MCRYFFDPDEEALYYTFNGTDQPTGDEQFRLTTTKVLFSITGTMATPVKRVRIQGLTIRDAALTFLGTSEADRHWLVAHRTVNPATQTAYQNRHLHTIQTAYQNRHLHATHTTKPTKTPVKVGFGWNCGIVVAPLALYLYLYLLKVFLKAFKASLQCFSVSCSVGSKRYCSVLEFRNLYVQGLTAVIQCSMFRLFMGSSPSPCGPLLLGWSVWL
jgi:hypothetical protein